MKLILRVESGEHTGREIRLKEKEFGRVGSSDAADLAVQDDQQLKELHFEVVNDPDNMFVRALPERTIHVNGNPVQQEKIKDGDYIVAGTTMFYVKTVRDRAVAVRPPATTSGTAVGSMTVGNMPTTTLGIATGASMAVTAASATPVAPSPAAAKPPREARIIEQIWPDRESLFGIFDAARNENLVKMLDASTEAYESLYSGREGDDLAHVAPYLVQFSPGSPLLHTLVKTGWGQAWGLYFHSSEDFEHARRHLRHFLMVKAEDGQQMYFRFYDPRVLRIFLPACQPEEIAQLFGPISTYLMEDADNQIVVFVRDQHNCLVQRSVTI